jgi:hypothetical protein
VKDNSNTGTIFLREKKVAHHQTDRTLLAIGMVPYRTFGHLGVELSKAVPHLKLGKDDCAGVLVLFPLLGGQLRVHKLKKKEQLISLARKKGKIKKGVNTPQTTAILKLGCEIVNSIAT